MGDANEMSLRVESDPDQIEVLGEAGFCLVECSVGGRSLVCELELDHHNDYSHLQGVAISAYGDTLFGVRRN